MGVFATEVKKLRAEVSSTSTTETGRQQKAVSKDTPPVAVGMA